MMGRVSAFLLLASLPHITLSEAAQSRPTLKVLIRYDDFARSSNAAIEERLFEGVRKAGGRTLVGVVPYSGQPYPRPEERAPSLDKGLGASKVAELKRYVSKGEITVALHGYSHDNHARAGAQKSEFAGLPRETQTRLLQLGKNALEHGLRTKVDVFIPPWDHYDEHLIQALQEAGIHVLSSDLRHWGPSGDIAYVPGASLPERLKWNVSTALRRKRFDGILVVVAHGYDFNEIGEPSPEWRSKIGQVSVDDILKDLVWVASQANVKLVSIEDLRTGEDLSLPRVEANRRLRESVFARYRLVPEIFGLDPVPGILYSRALAERMMWQQYTAAAIIYGTALLIGFTIMRRLRRTQISANKPRRYLGATGLAVALALFLYAISRHLPVKMVAAALSFGALLAFIPLPTRIRGAIRMKPS